MNRDHKFKREGRKPRHLLLWAIGSIAIFAAAVWLLVDSFSFALMPADPEVGRARGCYTAVELWLGFKEPTWIRTAEQISSLALFSVLTGLGIVRVLARVVRRQR